MEMDLSKMLNNNIKKIDKKKERYKAKAFYLDIFNKNGKKINFEYEKEGYIYINNQKKDIKFDSDNVKKIAKNYYLIITNKEYDDWMKTYEQWVKTHSLRAISVAPQRNSGNMWVLVIGVGLLLGIGLLIFGGNSNTQEEEKPVIEQTFRNGEIENNLKKEIKEESTKTIEPQKKEKSSEEIWKKFNNKKEEIKKKTQEDIKEEIRIKEQEKIDKNLEEYKKNFNQF